MKIANALSLVGFVPALFLSVGAQQLPPEPLPVSTTPVAPPTELQRALNHCLRMCGLLPAICKSTRESFCVPGITGYVPAAKFSPSAFIVSSEWLTDPARPSNEQQRNFIVVRTKNFFNVESGSPEMFNNDPKDFLLPADTAVKADRFLNGGRLTAGFINIRVDYTRESMMFAVRNFRVFLHGRMKRCSFDRDTHFLNLDPRSFHGFHTNRKAFFGMRLCTDLRTINGRPIHRPKVAMAPIDDCWRVVRPVPVRD